MLELLLNINIPITDHKSTLQFNDWSNIRNHITQAYTQRGRVSLIELGDR